MAKTKCFIRFSDENLKEKYKKSRCIFTISVGQQTHENEHFDATIELLNQSFASCVMLVDDSLQRYTMAFEHGHDPEYFYETSLEEGNLWLERNARYYNKLNNLEKIIRWDTWLHHPSFPESRQAILNLIDADEEYSSAFSHSVDEFVNKYKARLPDTTHFDVGRAKKLSFDFILEECTALTLWQELNCAYEVYPNLHNRAINETRQRFVLERNPELLNSVTLGFRNAKQLSPQRFLCLEEKQQNKQRMNKQYG